MSIPRRHFLSATAAAVLSFTGTRRPGPRALGAKAATQNSPPLRIGVLTDLSGPYRDVTGPTSVVCVREAIREFTAAGRLDVEVLAADHQNKPDIGAAIVRQWFDQSGVDAIADVGNSALALAVSGICREKNKVLLATSAGTADLTGKLCSPNTVHWTWDTWMAAKANAASVIKTAGDTWFLIAPDYALGHQLVQDATGLVSDGGGKILGHAFYPFPETTDFSAYLNQAQTSGAKILGLCNSGTDTVNSVKQAREFNVHRRMQVIMMLGNLTTVHALRVETAQGLWLNETFYWDLNARTRAFTDRVRPDTPNNWPHSVHAGNYAATLHYLKAAEDVGVAEAKADGRAVVARMKKLPTNDDCFGEGYIREDGRKIHPSYLFEVKSPAESKQEWDLFKPIGTTPAEQAFRPLSSGYCPLVHS